MVGVSGAPAADGVLGGQMPDLRPSVTSPRGADRPDGGDEIVDPVIEVDHLDLWYGRKHALGDVSLSFARKQVTALIGPSGCGKSTLLRCINRMNDLIQGVRVQGAIRVDGANIYDRSIDPVEVRRTIGMVFQKPNPFPKSIYENVAFGARINGYRGNMDELVERALRQAALWDTVSRPVMNIRFTSSPKILPSSENAPRTITTSCSVATIAHVAYRTGRGTDENASAMYPMMNNAATTTASPPAGHRATTRKSAKTQPSH